MLLLPSVPCEPGDRLDRLPVTVVLRGEVDSREVRREYQPDFTMKVAQKALTAGTQPAAMTMVVSMRLQVH